MRRVERSDPPGFEIDRGWLARGALVLVVVGFVVVLAKASLIAFDRGGHRLDRQERAAEAGEAASPAGSHRAR